MNNESVISQMKSVATALIPKGGSAILYGSRARGDAKTNFDWDILTLLDKPQLTSDDYEYACLRVGYGRRNKSASVFKKRMGSLLLYPIPREC